MRLWRNIFFGISRNLVGAGRFERPTPCAQGRCATRLRYAPTFAAPSILNRFAAKHTFSCWRGWAAGAEADVAVRLPLSHSRGAADKVGDVIVQFLKVRLVQIHHVAGIVIFHLNVAA